MQPERFMSQMQKKGKCRSMNNTNKGKERGNSCQKKMKRSPDERHTQAHA